MVINFILNNLKNLLYQLKSSQVLCPIYQSSEENCFIQHCSINGGWSNWSAWSSCSKTCGTGVKKTTRSCNNPIPQYGGRLCVGNSFKESVCTTNRCQGKL